jgi:hypothetical protein
MENNNSIFYEELERKFSQYDNIKRKLGQTNFDVNKAKELFEDTPEEINIDVAGLRKQFSIFCVFGMVYLYSLYRFSKNKVRVYFRTGYPIKVITYGVPFTLLNLFTFNKTLEFVFERLLKNKFVEKILEKEKNEPDYANHKKLTLNQLNYYIRRKNSI